MGESPQADMELMLAVLRELADGESRGPDSLAVAPERLRALLPQLAEYGVRQRRDGSLRLIEPIELLDPNRIRVLAEDAAAGLVVRAHGVVTSTNDLSRAEVMAGAPLPALDVAEAQTAGRGRRGRSWSSPLAANLYWTLALELPGGALRAQGASLVAGLAAAEAIEQVAPVRVQLKWPNDLLVEQRKLGGILVELLQLDGRAVLVIGIGINVAMPAHAARSIDQAWIDLRSAAGQSSSRNQLAAELVRAMRERMDTFAVAGLSAPLRAAWQSRDPFRGQRVVARSDHDVWHGLAAGIDASGALLLETETGPVSISAGQVSLRLEDPAS